MTSERRDMLIGALALAIGLPLVLYAIYWVGSVFIEHLAIVGSVVLAIPVALLLIGWLASERRIRRPR